MKFCPAPCGAAFTFPRACPIMVGKDPAGHPARAGKGKGENGMEKILKLLEENARMSVEDIAGITGDTPEAVARKLDEYAKNHVINGYHALVDWEKAGVPRVQAIIELRVSPRRESGFDEIAETIANFEEVDSVMLMSGGYDLALVLNGKSYQEIALFVVKRLSPLEGVVSTATHFVLRTYKKEGVLFGLEPLDEREFGL